MVFFEYKNGAEGQNRTAHTGIFSPLLYQLSYLGTTRRVFIARRRVWQALFSLFGIFLSAEEKAVPSRQAAFTIPRGGRQR